MIFKAKKLYDLSRWLCHNGIVRESRAVTDLIRKNAQDSGITLEQLRAELPGAMIASTEGIASSNTPLSESELQRVLPYIDIDRNIAEISMQDIKNELSQSSSVEEKKVEFKILNENFSLKHTDTANLDMSLMADVQRLLKAKSLEVPLDGGFSVQTKDALVAFQAANGLGQNGELNKETLLALRDPSTKGAAAIDTGSFEVGDEEQQPSVQSQAFKVDNPGMGEILRQRKSPEVIPTRTAESGEIFTSKFSFVEEPCLNCAAMAIQESKDNWDNGNISESDKAAEETIMEYFRYSSQHNSWKQNLDRWGFEGTRRFGPMAGKNQMNPVKKREQKKVNGEWVDVATDWYHWSAVFTSFIMGHHDGEGAKWFVSEAHTPYIESYQKKRREIEKDPESHKDKMYYVWFTKQEMDSLGMKPEPGDLVGTKKHCDIYVGNGQMIGGNTCAKSEYTGGRTKNCKGTSGPQPIKWKSNSGIIKRIRVTGAGKNRNIA